MTTLWEKEYFDTKMILSLDKTMIAIQDTADLNKGWLLSINNNNNYKCSTRQFNFEENDGLPVLLRFTPDDKYIIYATIVGLRYWSVIGWKFIDKYLVYPMNGLKVVNCSPNIRQFIECETQFGRSTLYIKSIF